MTNKFRITLTLVLIAFQCTSLFGQNENRVAQKVEEFKRDGGSFKTTTLTILNSTPQGRTDGSLFQLDRNQLTELSQSESPLQLSVPDGKNGSLTLELIPYQVVSDNFVLKQGNTIVTPIFKSGKHYRGIIKDDNNSMVALSFFENELRGTIRTASDNFVIGKATKETDVYTISNSRTGDNEKNFVCETEEDGKVYSPEQLASPFNQENGRVSAQNILDNTIIRVYIEVDTSITNYFADIQNTINFTLSLFNQSFIIYQNENIKMQISEIVVWDNNTTPYSSGASLPAFQERTDDINGHIGHLIKMGNSGIAGGFDGLCNTKVDKKLCVTGLSPDAGVVAFPNYSWNAYAITHEMGHLLGSRHTHACVWNGNGTAIDGCPGYTEWNCSLPPLPSNGGTIMSYCFWQNNVVFSQGFGEQPGNVIRNNVIGAQCLNSTQPAANTYCTAQGLNTSNDYIKEVKINDILNVSNQGNGYSDFTTQAAIDLTAGNTSSLTLTAGTFMPSDITPWRVWIDYNRNYRFDPSEELTQLNDYLPENTVTTTTFTVPRWAYPGVTRMRVIYSPNDYTTPCEIFERGEVEDYAVKIINDNLNYGDRITSLINKVVASDRTAGNNYGYSVSISGNYAISTAPLKDSNKGAAYILKKDVNGKWIQHQIITASDRAVGDYFGYAVTMKGNVILIGAPYDDNNKGAVYVFRKNEQTGNWEQTQKLTASDALTNMYFGISVSMVDNVAVIGAHATTTSHGSAYIFTASNNLWSQVQKLASPDSKRGAKFGTSVSISESSTTILVGATFENTNTNKQSPLSGAGGVYVFAKSGSLWTFQQKLVSPARGETDQFGTAVSVTEKTIIIGATGRDINGIKNSGAAYMFQKNIDKNTWEYDTQFISTDPRAEDWFGNSVSVSGDYVIIGTSHDDMDWTKSVVTKRDAGAVFIFKKNAYSKKWVATKKITAPDRTSNDLFGCSFAMENDQLVIGSINTDLNEAGAIVSNAGGAYFYKIDNYTEPIAGDLVQSLSGDSRETWLGWSVDIFGDRAVATTYNFNSTPNTINFYERDADGKWEIKQKVEAPHVDLLPAQSYINAIFAGRNSVIVASPHELQNGVKDVGAVYTYEYINNNWIQTARLTQPSIGAASMEGKKFGEKISADGDQMIIGARGSIHFYERISSGWVNVQSTTFAEGISNLDIVNGLVLVNQGNSSPFVFRRHPTLPQWIMDEQLENKFYHSLAILSDKKVLVGYKNIENLSSEVGYLDCVTKPCRRISILSLPPEFAHLDLFADEIKVSGSNAVLGSYNHGTVFAYQLGANGVWDFKNLLSTREEEEEAGYNPKLAISGNTAMVGFFYKNYHTGVVTFFDLSAPRQPLNDGPRTQELIGQSNQLAVSLNLKDTTSEAWVMAYPNPTENILHLDLSLDKNEEAQVQIFSATGEVRFKRDFPESQHITLTDFSSYSTGIYLVKINTSKRSETIKIIKK